MTIERSHYLSKVRRVVVKIGSSLLTDEKRKGIQLSFLRHLAEQVRGLQNRGIQCVIVTSGAIAAGLFELRIEKRPKEISKLQALAAVGQSALMHAYERTFSRFKLKVAQILLTRDDLAHRHRYANAHNTLMELFHHRIVPIVNENDTVAVEEIKFGNNDILGSLVTHLSEADLLVVLTDTDGLFVEDPRLNPKAQFVSNVLRLDDDIENYATGSKSLVGTGGMQTKIQAAKNMMKSGIPMIIANGEKRLILKKILDSENVGTFFFPSVIKMNSRKRWLAWSVEAKGEIVIDEGAKKALLEKNKSLLPTGVRQVLGLWEKGDIVKMIDLNHQEVAKGVSNYSSRELEKIKGLRSTEIIGILGHPMPDEVVHRDNLVKLEHS